MTRIIERTNQFKKDYKRESKGRYALILQTELIRVISILSEDSQMEARYRDHALAGNWKDFRDCHIKPDLVLIYRLPDEQTLQLVRLGSHSELGL